MTIFFTRFASLCTAVCVLVWAVGCTTPAEPDTHYLLSADGPAPSGVAEKDAIGLGPVSIPDYVNRPELVFERGSNRFEVPANHRWMGSLESNVTDVLAANLARRLDAGVVTYPWSGVTPGVTVAVDIRKFHAITEGDAVLEAAWHLSDAPNRAHHAALEEPLENDGYDAIVAAESRLLARLADAIAASLKSE